jgi:hypothetical protein
MMQVNRKLRIKKRFDKPQHADHSRRIVAECSDVSGSGGITRTIATE